MFGGVYFAGAYFAGVLRTGAAAAALSGSVSLVVTTTGAVDQGPAYLAGATPIVVTTTGVLDGPPAYLAGDGTTAIVVTTRGDLTVPVETGVGIIIGGVNVTGRVRVQGLTIHDILNDAPNTATLTIEGEAPAVGQSVLIQTGNTVLFTGAVQTVDASYESKPVHRVWQITAIDDTARANARRPFGTYVNYSATYIAQDISARFAPTFSTAGIVADPLLPTVSIVFDGADTLIGCLSRLATAIGGYCKIEYGTVYLFLEDLADPPSPIDQAHRFLANPPVQMNTDASQLRTRVYGKGYGESITSDIHPGSSQIPIQDGAQFPPLGGTAIMGLTPDGAQSDVITFTETVLRTGGSLVGTGSSPSAAPKVALAPGAGTTSGLHTVSVAYRTAAGQSLASPPATITTGTHPPPASPPLANPPTNGTGPDQGSHEYAVSFLTSYGETIAGPPSASVTTSAASGQLDPPDAFSVGWPALAGAGLTDGRHSWRATFVNANGETEGGWETGYYGPIESQLVGKTDPVVPQGPTGTAQPSAGGNLTANQYYDYRQTMTTAMGESLPQNGSVLYATTATYRSCTVTLATSPDARVTGRKLYRRFYPNGPFLLCATIANNTASSHYDALADSAIAGNPTIPTVDTTADPGHMEPFNRIQLSYIPTGPAGTTARKLYRAFNYTDEYYLIATLNNNTATTYLDQSPNNFTVPVCPTSNTTGTAIQRVPVVNIPTGPDGVTGRRLYRRFNGAGAFLLVTDLAGNTATTYTDGKANSALGAASLGTATAVGNQIAVTLPIGASAVTARELYYSPVGGTPRRLLWTAPDNTTTVVNIVSPDQDLTGPLEPTFDTSGLQQPSGQVNPGASSFPVAWSGPFRPGGGWVILGGGQVVWHAGISGNNLTGIPTSGPGAITTAVIYGSQAIPSPMLIGVTGVPAFTLKGSKVHIWIQRDDLVAQAEHAARTGGDGVVEFLIADGRRGVESLTARCDADLALFSRPIITVSYATRDLKTKSGKPIVINLPTQGIVQTLTIQDVTITELDIAKGLPPRFTVKASSVRLTLEDTLRRMMQVGPVSVNT